MDNMKTFTGALFVAVASATDFDDFKNQFQKSYANGEEESYRKGIFESNVEFVKSENARQSEYQLGVNQFADLLVHEWTAQNFGLARPEKPFGDVPYLGRHEVGNVTLPSSVDWTTKGAVTPVKNQGQCGSCWSFSATGAMEGAYEIATKKLVSISEQELVDCAQAEGEQGCNGGLMDGAFTYAKKTGMCTEESYAYKAKGGTCKASSCTKAFDAGVVTGYKDVSTDDEQAMMSAVAQQPTSIAIEADKSVFQLYKSGVLSGLCGSSLDHGVLAVGYGTATDGGDYWKVKNSWGATWGDNGYVLLKRGKGGSGECGLLAGPPSYPIISSQAPSASITV